MIVQGIVIVVPVVVFSVTISFLISVYYFIPNIFLTMVAITQTPRWDCNVKFLAMIVTAFLFVFWLPFVLVSSFVLSLCYGLIAPLIIGLEKFYNGDDLCGLFDFGSSTNEIFSNISNNLYDFSNANKSYQSFIHDFRVTPNSDGNVKRISLIKIPINIMITIIATAIITLCLGIVIIILWIPLTFKLFKNFYNIFCCPYNNICYIVMFSIPIFFLSLSIFLVVPILLLIIPIVSLFGAVKSVIYANKNNNLTLIYSYGKEFAQKYFYQITNTIYKNQRIFYSFHTNNFENALYDAPVHISICEPEISMINIWNTFFQICEIYTRKALMENLISLEDIETLEPYLFIGLPSLIMFKVFERSHKNEDLVLEMSDNVVITEINRPKNVFFDYLWSIFIDLRADLTNILLTEHEKKYLEIFLVTMNNETKIPMEIEILCERKKQIIDIATKFHSLGITISRLPQVHRKFGNILETISRINV
jgi:hypothetical protein